MTYQYKGTRVQDKLKERRNRKRTEHSGEADREGVSQWLGLGRKVREGGLWTGREGNGESAEIERTKGTS